MNTMNSRATGRWFASALMVAAVLVISAPRATAATYVCKGERIEKGSSTWGYAKSSGGSYRIEKGSNSIGWAKERNSRWAIESFAGSTLGWLEKDSIRKPGGTLWARLSDAANTYDCPAPIAAALWVLKQAGKF